MSRKLAFTYQRRSTPRASVKPTIRDLEWAAGFLEGEGGFRGERTNEQVYVGQVQKEPLLRLQRLFGGSIRARRATPRDQYQRSPLSVWVLCGSRARGLMMTLYTLMSTRRKEQIRVALEGA